MARLRRIPTPDLIALFLAILTVFGTYFVADRIYERMPHFEDEMAYVWEAQAISGGTLVLPSPPNPKSFLIPFVIDYHGVRFSKYPPGWPTVLALGVLTGLRAWVNPVLAGLGIWLLYLLAKRLTTSTTGLLAVILMLTSPMFWMLSGSLLSHAWSLVLALGFVLAWLDVFNHEGHQEHKEKSTAPFMLRPAPAWMPVFVAGLNLGILALTRPIDAAGVGLPFFVHGLVLLARGDRSTRKHVLTVGLLAALVAGLFFVWQFAMTGNPLLNPYTLWWKYDKFGFGQGYGRWVDGHNLQHAWENLRYSLRTPHGTGGDILGWGNLWWIFLPFGLWALRKKLSAWLVAGIFPALLLVYIPYWIGSWEYGPRYYYDGMLSITILSAAGITWLAGHGMRMRKVLAGFALVVLVGYNLVVYLPNRLGNMHSLYSIDRAMLAPFSSPEALEKVPALVIVHAHNQWTEYGGLLELQNAQLNTPFIFAIYRWDTIFADYRKRFPGRKIYHYYPDQSFTFYPQ